MKGNQRGMIFSKPSQNQHFDKLWEYYSDGQCVVYKDFISKVTRTELSNESRVLGNSTDALKQKFVLQGPLGLLNFALSLPNQLTSSQLQEALRRQGIDVDYQIQGDYIGASNLINQIKGPLSQLRAAILTNVYQTFDQTPLGVSPQYISQRYNADRHPDIKHLGRSTDDIREELFQGLSGYVQLTGIRSFSQSDFLDFYTFFGLHIQNEELFRSIITAVYDLDQSPQQSPESVKSKSIKPPPSVKNLQQNFQQLMQQQLTPNKQDEQSVASRKSVPKSQARSSTSQLSQNAKQVELIVQRIRNRLISRGARGFISLYRVSKMLDADNDGQLNLQEFRKVIREHKIEVTDPEIDLVFSYFDRDNSGVIDLWGFMYVLRGEMNPFRIQLAEQVFEKFKQGEFVLISNLRNNFTVRNHPDLKSGKKQDDELVQDFFEPLLLLHNINGGFGHENISKDELIEFFSNFSAAIADDKYFEQILISLFRLDKDQTKNHHAGGKQVFDPDHKRGYLQDHHRYVIAGGSVSANAPFGTTQQEQQQRPSTAFVQPQSFNIFKPLDDSKSQKAESQVSQPLTQSNRSQQQQVHYPIDAPKSNKKIDSIQVIRNKILSRGLRGLIGIQLKFQLYDKQHLGTLSQNEWLNSFKQWRLDVNENILIDIFNQIAINGMIAYDGFIKSILGTMTLRKFNLIQQIYETFPKQTVEAIKFSFNAKEHPDVKFNRRREDDLLCEFIDTFEQFHQVFTGSDYIKNPVVTFEEFLGYNNNIAALIEDDSLFEQLLVGVWGLRKRF
ncbi:hypothetical protein pb186bvf_010041 [Paramecium bursaria]